MYILQFWNVYPTVRKKDFVFLGRVMVSSEYFPVLDCVSYRCARKRSWLSLWLGLAVGIVQCWNVYCTVRKNVFVFLARVRVSNQYFPVLDCVSYSCARKRSWLSLWLGLAVYIYSVGMDIVQYARRTSCFSLGLGLAVIFVQFYIVYHSVARERDRGSRCG